MKKILVVEDSEMVVKVLRHVLQAYPGFEAVYASNLQQAQTVFAEHQGNFFAALVDLVLPDAINGEVVDFTLGKTIPTVVLTSIYEEQRREQLFNKGVVDYVTKEGRDAYHTALEILRRLEKNRPVKVLVVDAGDVSRTRVSSLLKRHLFQVIEAVDGVDAIKVLLENPEIKLLITDYHLPRMEGIELVRNVRCKYDKTQLMIIGMTDAGSDTLSAKFIRQGANDLLSKPFHPEEFYCRVIRSIESLELIEQLTYYAERDHLTGLYHRSYFFKAAREMALNALEKSTPLAAAIINIDNFREINQRYGNRGGDIALCHVASLLQRMLDRFLLSRGEGDSFYVLMPGLDNEKAVSLISKVRHLVVAEPLTIDGETIYCNFSAGVTNKMCERIDDQLIHAEKFLRLAKEASGGLVVGDDDEGMH